MRLQNEATMHYSNTHNTYYIEKKTNKYKLNIGYTDIINFSWLIPKALYFLYVEKDICKVEMTLMGPNLCIYFILV